MMHYYEGNSHNYVVEADERKQINEVTGLLTGWWGCRCWNAGIEAFKSILSFRMGRVWPSTDKKPHLRMCHWVGSELKERASHAKNGRSFQAFLKTDVIYLFSERGGSRERGRKTSIGCLSSTPNQGWPWLPRQGIEPVIFLFAGQCPTHWVTSQAASRHFWSQCSWRVAGGSGGAGGVKKRAGTRSWP